VRLPLSIAVVTECGNAARDSRECATVALVVVNAWRSCSWGSIHCAPGHSRRPLAVKSRGRGSAATMCAPRLERWCCAGACLCPRGLLAPLRHRRCQLRLAPALAFWASRVENGRDSVLALAFFWLHALSHALKCVTETRNLGFRFPGFEISFQFLPVSRFSSQSKHRFHELFP
jgi:hypothetical protein